ncbi:MAG: fibronectin type III domain-containing protein [Bacteroidia bacterium]|nr:fibronectin type III domain-containing protein [Bacteroidia bacterium]
MATATFKLFGLTIPELIQKVRDIRAKIIINIAVYASPNPSMVQIKLETDALETSYEAAINGGKDKKMQMQLNKQTVMQSMSILQAYVQTTSGGDASKIILVADVKNPRSPVGILPPPGNVRTAYGNLEGEIIIRWAGVPKRSIYKLQKNDTPNDDTQWKDLTNGLTSAKRFVAGGMVSGNMYGFRIATVSSDGIGGWSDATYHRAK